jgi:hypothetical protein
MARRGIKPKAGRKPLTALQVAARLMKKAKCSKKRRIFYRENNEVLLAISQGDTEKLKEYEADGLVFFEDGVWRDGMSAAFRRVQEGMKCTTAASTYNVSPRSLQRYAKEAKKEGPGAKPRVRGPGPQPFFGDLEQQLANLFRQARLPTFCF